MEANHTCPAIAYFMLTQHLDYPAALAYFREHFHDYEPTEEEKVAVGDYDESKIPLIMRMWNVDKATAALLNSVPYEYACDCPTDEDRVALNPLWKVGEMMLMKNMTLEQAWQEYVRDQVEDYLNTFYERMNHDKDIAFGPHDWHDFKIRATSQGTDTVIVTIHI